MRYIERDLPIEGLNVIFEKEGNAKKPISRFISGGPGDWAASSACLSGDCLRPAEPYQPS